MSNVNTLSPTHMIPTDLLTDHLLGKLRMAEYAALAANARVRVTFESVRARFGFQP